MLTKIEAETALARTTPLTKTPTTKRQDLDAILAQIVLEAGYNTNLATSILEKRAKKETWLSKFLTDKFLMRACREAVRSYMRFKIRPASKGNTSFPDPHGENPDVAFLVKGSAKKTWASIDGGTRFVGQLAEANRERLMYMPLPIKDQVLLKDANKTQILEASTYYLSRIKDNLKWGTFLKKVAALMPDDERTAGQVLKEKDLEAVEAQVEVANGYI